MENLKLRLRAGEYEFEAHGDKDSVLEQFEDFKNFITLMPIKQKTEIFFDDKQPELSPSPTPTQKTEESFPDIKKHLTKILCQLPTSPFFACSVLPQGKDKDADTALILLLGFLFFKNQREVSVLNLNQALKKSGISPNRLDRMLSAHIRNLLVIKTGKGKGGSYQLTQNGARQAKELAMKISNLLL